MSESVTPSAEYNELLDSIKRTLAAGQLRAARAVSSVLVETYWQIGQEIVGRRQKRGWGAKVTDRLSADLRLANPGVHGLSPRNLRYMATLASRWPSPIGQRAVAQLPWSLVTTLLDCCPDPEIADLYAQRAVTQVWTRTVLQTMIASRLHERTQPALTNFDRAVPEADQEAIRNIVKDPFVVDFLAADPIRERDLSKALTANLTQFLRELGNGFAFVGAEVPISCGDREFFGVDLLFYHCRLHCYVVFELKLGHFEPEYVGKLNFYVQLVDDHLRDQARDDQTLGVLLVVGRDVTVEIALRGVSTPLAVTEWRRLPAKVRQALPTAEDLRPTVTRTVREIESTTPVALCRPEAAASSSSVPVPSSSWTRQRGRAR